MIRQLRHVDNRIFTEKKSTRTLGTSCHLSQGVNSRLEEMQHKVFFDNVCHVLSFGAEMYQQITDRERVGLLAVGF